MSDILENSSNIKRLVSLDTETSGTNPSLGHKIVEIGCVELIGGQETGRVFQQYLNPERDIPDDAFKVHGITLERVKDEPRFAEAADRFLAFIEGATLVIHNADFDLGFLNAELAACGRPALTNEVCDTMVVARRKFPGRVATLDALCNRFKVDKSGRQFHGALLDASLLAQVYVRMFGVDGLGLGVTDDDSSGSAAEEADLARFSDRTARPLRPAVLPTDEELAGHAKLVGYLKGAIWTRILAETPQ